MGGGGDIQGFIAIDTEEARERIGIFLGTRGFAETIELPEPMIAEAFAFPQDVVADGGEKPVEAMVDAMSSASSPSPKVNAILVSCARSLTPAPTRTYCWSC